MAKNPTIPEKQFTMLDCHDGIPVLPDLERLIDTQKARKTVENMRRKGSPAQLDSV